jgi:hypothetical protein
MAQIQKLLIIKKIILEVFHDAITIVPTLKVKNLE